MLTQSDRLRHRRIRWIVLASIAALLGVSFAVRTYMDGRRIVYTGDGPINGIDGRAWDGHTLEGNERRTYAGLSMRNRRDKPIVLEAFRTVPPLDGGLRLLEASMATDQDRRTNEAAAFPGYPAPLLDLNELRPIRGTTIQPGDGDEKGAALVLGLEITRPGIFWWERIDVDYRYEGRSYTVKNNLGAYFCGPKSALPGGRCPEWDEHPRDMCKTLGYVPFGDNGCVPPGAETVG